jgi:hypothetical protein
MYYLDNLLCNDMLTHARTTHQSSLFDITLIEKIPMADKRTSKYSSVLYGNLHASVVTTFLILISIPYNFFTFSIFMSIFLFSYFWYFYLRNKARTCYGKCACGWGAADEGWDAQTNSDTDVIYMRALCKSSVVSCV